jgi:predicted GIY-YIG superfamily endonuclease
MEPRSKSLGLQTNKSIKNRYFYVYILNCNNGHTYTGYTQNLKERLQRHHKGYVPATKHLRPLQLITTIAFTDKYKAIAFEKYLKTGSGRAFMKRHLI